MEKLYTKCGKEILVCDKDYDLLKHFRWTLARYTKSATNFNHIRTRRNKTIDGKVIYYDIFIHHLIMGKKPGLVIDHINHNGFDNRRCNLRFATRQQNNYNKKKLPSRSSKYLGVSKCKDNKCNPWHAYVSKGRKRINVGWFKTEIEAAKARDALAKELHGEFASLNFKT